jgi:Domain of unknown function (DUF4129)
MSPNPPRPRSAAILAASIFVLSAFFSSNLRALSVPPTASSVLNSSVFYLSFFFQSQPTPEPQPSPTSQTPSQTLDLSTYQSELSRIQELSESAIAAKDQQQLTSLRASLPSSWHVNTPTQQFTVSTAEISSELRAIAQNLPLSRSHATQLTNRLRTMQQEAAALQNAINHPNPNAAKADAKLKTILSRAQFQESTGPTAMEILKARVQRWLVELIINLFKKLHIGARTGNFLGWAIIVLALLVLSYYAYLALTKSSANPVFAAEVTPFPSDARHWLTEAQAAAERGDFREAIHCAYWASVARLEDLRLLTRDRARTPRESLRLLDPHPREQTLLRPITSSFELIWYGYRPASLTDWQGAKDHLEKIGCL